MKRILIVLITCLLTTVASAQKITASDLQGNWKLATFSTEGIFLDIISGEVILSNELKSELTPSLLEQLNDNMKQGIEVLKSSYMIFTGNSVKQNKPGNEKNGTFIIKEINEKQHILITFNDGSTYIPEVVIKNQQLYLTEIEQGEMIHYIFSKK